MAAEALELWKAAYPRDFRPANALAVIYNRTGRYDRAVAEAQEALRRSPGHPFPLSNLAFAFERSDAMPTRRTAEEAVKLGVETTPTRVSSISWASSPATAPRPPTAWAKSKPREFDLVSAEAQAAAFEGRLRDAGTLYQHAIDIALARG